MIYISNGLDASKVIAIYPLFYIIEDILGLYYRKIIFRKCYAVSWTECGVLWYSDSSEVVSNQFLLCVLLHQI